MLLKVVSTGSKDGNCYILDNENEALMLDCGSKYQDIMKVLDFDIYKLVGILVTHEHGDHIKSYKKFSQSLIDVYGHPGLPQKFEGIKPLEERKAFQLGGFRIVPFYVPHTSNENGQIVECKNYAYLISHKDMGKMIYATDFEYIPFSFANMQIAHWLIECNYVDSVVDSEEFKNEATKYKHVLQGHCSLNTCKAVIEKNMSANMKNIILCHISQDNGHPTLMKREIGKLSNAKTYIAMKGCEIYLE